MEKAKGGGDRRSKNHQSKPSTGEKTVASLGITRDQSSQWQSVALEKYAKLARNFDAEHRAAEIRILAERRAGELLKVMEKAKGARQPGTKRGKVTLSDESTASKKISDLGITRDQSSQWQQLASAPH